MAGPFAVRNGGDFCRDCGGPMTRLADEAYCENTTTQGTQQEPKDVCQALGREARLFCEFSGTRVAPGQTVCPVCGNKANAR